MLNVVFVCLICECRNINVGMMQTLKMVKINKQHAIIVEYCKDNALLEFISACLQNHNGISCSCTVVSAILSILKRIKSKVAANCVHAHDICIMFAFL